MKKVLFFLAICICACHGNKTPSSQIPEGAIDLGLSVYWASYNIGANKPEDYGDYYSWGEIETNQYYRYYTYKWRRNDSLIKYNTSRSTGLVDNLVTLEDSDDVAHVKLGDKWRMPTNDEWIELRTQCEWTWTTHNGIKGYLILAKNGNWIFLPAAGTMSGAIVFPGAGQYWSSSLCVDDPLGAWAVQFYSMEIRNGGFDRDSGFSIRPVFDK